MRNGGRARFNIRRVRALALPALLITLGLQLLRSFIPTLTWYLRDTVGLSSIDVAVYAFGAFLFAFLAAPLRRALGPGRALRWIATTIALLRFAEQVVFDPATDLWLAGVGTAAFLIFLPIFWGHVRALRGVDAAPQWTQGLVLGLALDSALKGATNSLDWSWIPGGLPAGAVGVLALLAIGLARSEPEPRRDVPAEAGWADTLPLLALGPYLFVQALIFQNAGWIAQVGGLEHPLAFLALMLGNLLAALGLQWGFSRPRSFRFTLAGAAAVYLTAATFTADDPGIPVVVTVLAGQFVMGWGWSLLATIAGPSSRPGIGPTSIVSGLSMILFLLFTFVYYASFDIALSVPRAAILPAAAAGIGLGWIYAAQRAAASGRKPQAVPAITLPMLALALVPLALWARQPAQPIPSMPEEAPIRVLTYNIHSAFNAAGRQDPEAIALAIEASDADVVALQEVSRGWLIDGSTDLVHWLSRRLGMPAIFQGTGDPVWGNAILSRYAILRHGQALLPREGTLLQRGYLWAEIDAGAGTPLLVIDTHLHHIEADEAVRTVQVERLVAFWNNRPFTVLLGDLNSEPGSTSMRKLEQAGLRDVWLLAGSGEGYTFPSEGPERRIDWIWITPDLAASDAATLGRAASDHLGVAATLETLP